MSKDKLPKGWPFPLFIQPKDAAIPDYVQTVNMFGGIKFVVWIRDGTDTPEPVAGVSRVRIGREDDFWMDAWRYAEKERIEGYWVIVYNPDYPPLVYLEDALEIIKKGQPTDNIQLLYA